ncbi:hypothetical protein [Pseudomonas aeruginosa]|uniref:hypothetical protein n=1 Tax=Pseudomonas aeruginosa TaxID=287 RepID=UPI000D4ABD81|nr:hypothetical protein [Pseudomonas aeruginosa]PRW28248.1 hypothetical protein CSB96_4645 [Pseudomonas aeruginosa]
MSNEDWNELDESYRSALSGALETAHPAVEQAGGDERAVDGKPRATKCPDCGEGDLMPGDLCACGYETDPAAGYACSECDGSGDGYVGEVCRECDGSGWFVTPEQARAALAQPSGEVVVTKNESGAIVSVTRQDKEGRVLSVIAESATLTAQAEKAEVERPEVVAWQYRVTAGPQTGWSLWHPGKGEEFERSYTVERRPLMTVAQYDRIVGELRAVIAQLRQHKNDYMDSGQETYRALQNEIREREAEIARLDGLVSGRTAERDAANARLHEVATACATAEQERDAALARVAELERQEPVALANRGLHAFWVKWTEAAAGLYGPGIKLYAAPVVQAQHIVPDVCDGKEQDAFEEWARNEGLDTSCHPMHWLFLDAKTNSARQGWKAALRYVRAQVAAPGKEGV